MGGWVAFVGQVDDFQARVDRFRKVFSVENVPALKTEIIEINQSFKILLWSWNKHSIPDVYVQKSKNGNALILCGVITGTGSFCIFNPDQEITSRNIHEQWAKANDIAIEQLNGSFSCVFYDSRKNETVSFVDRFASRSVWTYKENNIWIIGNFPSAIAACTRETPKIDLAGLWAVLHYGRHIGTHGIFEEMHCLLAGQKAFFYHDKKITVSNWWERRYRPESGLKAMEWGKRITEALRVSAERYKGVSPNPYLYLSGGLDSRIVAATCGKPMKTVTLCTQPNAETKNAARVARTLGLNHRTIIRSPHWYLDSASAAALISSGNYLSHNAHFIVPTMDIVGNELDATFYLGDLLENFNKHYFNVPRSRKLSFNPDTIEEDLYRMIPSTVKDKNRWGMHLSDCINKAAHDEFSLVLKDHSRLIENISDDPFDCYDSMLRWSDVSATYTYNMISCFWPFAKERNICFDNDLNEISLLIPASIRGSGKLHKWLLFNLNKKLLLIPDANYFLPPISPKWMQVVSKEIRPFFGKIRRGILRLKGNEIIVNTSGSWLLLHELYRKDPLYRNEIENLIKTLNAKLNEIFDSAKIKNSWDKYLEGEVSLYFELEALFSVAKLMVMF